MTDDMSRQIEQLNKAGAIMVGTKEGTPVSRESAQAIVEAIRKQQEKKQVTEDIVTQLRKMNYYVNEVASNHGS